MGLAELVQQAVYILHLHAAPGGDALLPGGVEAIRVGALVGRHGEDDGRAAVHDAVVDVHIVQLVAHAGQLGQDALDGAHLLHLLELLQQIV